MVLNDKNFNYIYHLNNQAEARAEFAEKTVKKLQKEVDRLEGMNLDYLKNIYLLNKQNIIIYAKIIAWFRLTNVYKLINLIIITITIKKKLKSYCN